MKQQHQQALQQLGITHDYRALTGCRIWIEVIKPMDDTYKRLTPNCGFSGSVTALRVAHEHSEEPTDRNIRFELIVKPDNIFNVFDISEINRIREHSESLFRSKDQLDITGWVYESLEDDKLAEWLLYDHDHAIATVTVDIVENTHKREVHSWSHS